MTKMIVVPTMGARTNREYVDRIRENSRLFDNMTIGTSIEQFKYFQSVGAVCISEMFISISLVKALS